MRFPIKCSDIILINYVAKSYTMSTRRFQQHSISKFFIRTISFEFHVTSQVSKHCRIISVVFIITYASIEKTYRSRKTHQTITILVVKNLQKCPLNLPTFPFWEHYLKFQVCEDRSISHIDLWNKTTKYVFLKPSFAKKVYFTEIKVCNG